MIASDALRQALQTILALGRNAVLHSAGIKADDPVFVCIRAICHTADAALATPPAVQAAPHREAWQPIETAPKDGKKILVAYTYLDQRFVDTAWWDKVYRRWFHDFAFGTKTHWQPLPQDPRVSKRARRRRFDARGQPQLIRAWGSTASTD